jgi:hypothetical protein
VDTPNAAYAAQARSTIGDDTTLAVEQLVVVEADPQQARRIARIPLGLLGKLPGYRAGFRRMGFDERDVEELTDGLVDGLVRYSALP